MAVEVAHHLPRPTPSLNEFPRYTVDGNSSLILRLHIMLYICDMYLEIKASPHPWFLDAIPVIR